MDSVTFTVVNPDRDDAIMAGVHGLLRSVDLTIDDDVEVLVVAQLDRRVVGCLGLAGPVLKSAAVDPDVQGMNLMGRLVLEVRYLALERGHSKLFLYTKPSFAAQFASVGFHKLAEVPGLVVLMEDDPRGLADYVRSLETLRVDGERIAGIVVNANPCTLGHLHLMQVAAAENDVVHVFVVGEDVSEFSYGDRFALVKAAVATLQHADRVVVHPGSRYVVSRASFPQYFLRAEADIAKAFTGIDLLLFRNHIAPALGIRHRYVGTEPASEITAQYNSDMLHWLTTPSEYPPIEVHVIERVGVDGAEFVSASKVRAHLAKGEIDQVAKMVPPSTLAFIKARGLAGTESSTGPQESQSQTEGKANAHSQ